MNGYQLPEVNGALEFEEGYWRGANVVVRLTAPLRVYFEILEAVDAGEAGPLRQGLERWASEALVEWNLVDREGVPVPATPEGFMTLPLRAAIELVRTWLMKIPDVDLPSDGGSPGTAISGTRRAPRRQPR